MDGFGIGLLILTTILWLVLISLPTHLLIVEKYYKGLFFIIPITIIYIYHTSVILTGTHNPGCVTWHAVGTNARLVGDESYYGGRWRNNEHWEHDIDYVPEDCDCITYHWFWGDENNFTQDSVIRGQFKGPSVKPNKLYVEEEEVVVEDEFFLNAEEFNGQWTINYRDIDRIIETAEEIEKQQIIDLYIEGPSAENNNGNSEQYYNENFKSK